MNKIKYILFDAANTLIHKPLLWERFQLVLRKFEYPVSDISLRQQHKLVSESIKFPDQTSKEFYRNFNSELLVSLGIAPSEKLLDEIFSSCTYLPWEKFDDTKILNSLNLPLGVLSNFNKTLNNTLEKEFGSMFKHVFISENYGVAKPNIKFYEIALKEIGIDPTKVLYIGDSIQLDIEPAEKASINSLLIDRDNVYPNYKNRISSLNELTLYL